MTDAAAAADPESGSRPGPKRLTTVLGILASLSVLGVALWFLHRELEGLSIAAITAHVRSIPTWALVASVAFAACSYVVLTGYDATALRYLDRPMPYRSYALTAFMAYAVGNNVGIATLSGGSVRYRLYSLSGLSGTEIAQIIAFVTLTYILGASALLGVALLSMPAAQSSVLGLPPSALTSAGIALLAVPCTYLSATMLRKTPLTIRHWRLPLPRPAIGVAQIVVSASDLTFAAATLYVLLEPALDIGFFSFLGIYLLAMAAGLISSVPGGIGVFEAILVATLPQVAPNILLGTILIYRLIYYVAPLILALMLLVSIEVRHHGRALQVSSGRMTDWLSGIAPQAIGALVFLAGIVLLVSGAIPAIGARLDLIARTVPLPLLELSHLTGSLVGVGLLILARSLYQRLHNGYLATLGLLAVGIVASLLKGLDYEEACILTVILIALWLCRAEFHRLGSVAGQRLPARWVAALLFVVCIVSWVGLVSYRGIAYSHELWWQFALDADAPRTLRAGMVAALAVMAFAGWTLLRTAPVGATPAPASDAEDKIRRVLETAEDAAANVALLGDKRLLWSPDERAFIMYQISGDSWIAMGDPVGPFEYHEDLAWAFRELVDRFSGRPVFYQVADRSLSLYIDLGLSLSKLGEDARVPLEGFSLEGSQRARLRQAVHRAERDGASFDVVLRADVPRIMADLRKISDEWLAARSTAEKAFSLGSFSPDYLQNFDCAVARVQGEIVAFANLWAAPAAGELSIDLMRHGEDAPKGMMDFLFAQLMLWGAANGYRWFSLGMAPLSGMEQRPLAPLWHKLGHFVYTHGESFYNFEGLRSYKEKFDPNWSPRYLACPGGWWDLPWALMDATRLIAGGATQMLRK